MNDSLLVAELTGLLEKTREERDAAQRSVAALRETIKVAEWSAKERDRREAEAAEELQISRRSAHAIQAEMFRKIEQLERERDEWHLSASRLAEQLGAEVPPPVAVQAFLDAQRSLRCVERQQEEATRADLRRDLVRAKEERDEWERRCQVARKHPERWAVNAFQAGAGTIALETSPQIAADLATLVKTGLFGDSPARVAEELLRSAVRGVDRRWLPR